MITLQNPHGLPSASVSSTSAKSATVQKDVLAKPAAAQRVTAIKAKEKEKLPCMCGVLEHTYDSTDKFVCQGTSLLIRPVSRAHR